MAGWVRQDELDRFARRFIHGVSHYGEVRTEDLAEAVRQHFSLSPFPRYRDLYALCQELNIEVGQLPAPIDGLDAVNTHMDGDSPRIHLNPDLPRRRAETAVCHELREVLENAFKRVKPRSDRFAGALLMRADATHDRLVANGFDFASFADDVARSLASVIVRVQQLYSAHGRFVGPVGGLWLFEPPWKLLKEGTAAPKDLVVTQVAVLSGFSTATKGDQAQRTLSELLPRRGAGATDHELVLDALSTGEAQRADVEGLDLFGDSDLVVIAEPLLYEAMPQRVLLTAMRRSSIEMVQPWLDTVGAEPRPWVHQTA